METGQVLERRDSFGGVQRSSFPNRDIRRVTVKLCALFGALFFEHCLLRVITKVELIMLPSTCNHLPYVGLRWKDSSHREFTQGGTVHY